MSAGSNRIAQLPRGVRELLNLRLQDGEPSARVLEWLNAQPEVRAMVSAGVDPPAFTEADLARWQEQGFADWLAQQEALAASRLMAEEVAEFNSGGAKPLSERLAAWLAVRYLAQSQRLRETTGDPEQDWRRLREFTSDVAALRRGDQVAERLDLERQWLSVEYEWLLQAKQDSHERWKRKLELALESLQTLVDHNNPRAREALLALAEAVRGPFTKIPEAPGEHNQAAPTGSSRSKCRRPTPSG